MAHSMGLLFITESIAKVKFVSKPYTYTLYGPNSIDKRQITFKTRNTGWNRICIYVLRHLFLQGSKAGEASWKQGNDAGEME